MGLGAAGKAVLGLARRMGKPKKGAPAPKGLRSKREIGDAKQSKKIDKELDELTGGMDKTFNRKFKSDAKPFYGKIKKKINEVKKRQKIKSDARIKKAPNPRIKKKRIKAAAKKGFKEGGMLKEPTNPGLKKLPSEVRNKMGYMEKGGKVDSRRFKKPKMGKMGKMGKKEQVPNFLNKKSKKNMTNKQIKNQANVRPIKSKETSASFFFKDGERPDKDIRGTKGRLAKMVKAKEKANKPGGKNYPKTMMPSKTRMKKGGSVKGKCRMDGIAVRGRTRAKERSK